MEILQADISWEVWLWSCGDDEKLVGGGNETNDQLSLLIGFRILVQRDGFVRRDRSLQRHRILL